MISSHLNHPTGVPIKGDWTVSFMPTFTGLPYPNLQWRVGRIARDLGDSYEMNPSTVQWFFNATEALSYAVLIADPSSAIWLRSEPISLKTWQHLTEPPL